MEKTGRKDEMKREKIEWNGWEEENRKTSLYRRNWKKKEGLTKMKEENK